MTLITSIMEIVITYLTRTVFRQVVQDSVMIFRQKLFLIHSLQK